ncbi:MAG: FkbM family methyltransferase [Gammaproteobacteria bacterium]|jgi:FkbM family methyltransferase|nr:FkbM family methyltransferase [Gammaproteobacteria bacterium]MBU2155419.1 FkbM family methyltransferase [Gammaproteobacteria bacterium]MBU2257121.1 FkbM family methyltransferase [Gammaproteobacteria bacterium]
METMGLSARLDALLSESLESIRDRQSHTLERLIGGLDRPFVLFGASHLGRKTQSVLKQMGFTPEAFIDNNPAAWGTLIDSIPVMSPAQLAERSDGLLPSVICTIWSGHITDRMTDRLAPLRALGFDRIALFGHLAWRHPEHFLPHYSLDLPEKVVAEADQIRRAFTLLSDDVSRQLFVDHIEWRLSLDHDLLPPASPLEIYFDGHFSSDRADEVLYDIGAFNGDSVSDYLKSGRGYREIHSFEPSPANYADLRENLEKLGGEARGLYAYPLAIGDCNGEILIEDSSGAASRVGRGSERVQITTIDDLSARIAPATFIKIDIEGFEPQCLAGGRRLIAEEHPVIAVCVYHEQNHLWNVLLQLHDYYPDYHFTLCPHLAEGWDLVLYAVPAARLPQQPIAE